VDGSTDATVCVVGGGPAGAMLALLLVRQGIDVVLLEKHADFLRDFRGDTVHPSTLEVLGEIGLAERFHQLPHRKVHTIGFVQDERRVDVADFRELGLRYPYIAFVPQWDFLDLLTGEAARHEGFRLMMRSRATGLVVEDGRVAGAAVETPDGRLTVRAALTVAADGRNSTIRAAAGVRPRILGGGMDVMLFRISRRPDDPDEGLSVRIGDGKVFGAIDRGEYWQVSYETATGGHARLRERGIESLRADLAALVPFLADRVHEVRGLDDVHLLEVRIDRLDSWCSPGLLFIGDAAHAMSPVGGFGINLAVQDAVATANLLGPALIESARTGAPPPLHVLRRVQRRRMAPTVLSQALQRATLRFGVRPALRAERVLGLSHPAALFDRVPLARRTMSRLTGVGFRPEHVVGARP
jgi:2-polyprenyl-6-methoxyphenol hydroxylase-like FAD-dependent oxidoreductase